MTDEQSGETGQQQAEATRWARLLRWGREETRFVIDVADPDSVGLTKRRRLAKWVVLSFKWAGGFVAGAVLGIFLYSCVMSKQAEVDDDIQGARDAGKGYVHASIRLKSDDSYMPPYGTFYKAKLPQSQVERFETGEYASSEEVEGGVAGVQFVLSATDTGYGQIYFFDLVSDSSSMVTVTDLDAVNIRCRKSEMVAQVDTPSEGQVDTKAVAFRLQGHSEARNGFIADSDDPNWGDLYFDHNTIALGGGADSQGLSVLGAANPGTRCTWDLRAAFTTDDGQEHRTKLNTKPLIAEGGPGEGGGVQKVRIDVMKVLRWACDHGQRKPEDCQNG
ncbi:hypothetical protein [Streptomyces sp. NPDC005989]|uniref:hypothetical protein n=1 Tax=Streptomyces sp. NPDC005989 TaxID=3156727 RepID=UPI00340B02E9